MKKKYIAMGLLIVTLFTSGYMFNTEAPYLKVKIDDTDNIYTFYITNSSQGDFIYDEVNHTLININSTIRYCYCPELTDSQGNNQRVSFPTYSQPYYIIGSTQHLINYVEIVENSGVQLYKRWIGDITTYIAIAILLILFMMLFRR